MNSAVFQLKKPRLLSFPALFPEYLPTDFPALIVHFLLLDYPFYAYRVTPGYARLIYRFFAQLILIAAALLTGRIALLEWKPTIQVVHAKHGNPDCPQRLLTIAL